MQRMDPFDPERVGPSWALSALWHLAKILLSLTCRNPHNVDRVADHVGGALFAFRASGHFRTVSLLFLRERHSRAPSQAIGPWQWPD
jgi:hypothetical protein